MGKVYSPPAEIGELVVNYADRNFDWQKAESEYIAKIVAFAKKNGKGALRGTQISFGVADGSAVYIIYSMSPVALIHVPVGDAYQFPYANRLTAADIKKKAGESAAWAKIFADHKAGV